MAKKVFSGLVTAWRLAGCPTRREPSSRMATTEGVVRAPSAFSITLGDLPSMIATQELVVPRSMPMILLMRILFSFLSWRTVAEASHAKRLSCVVPDRARLKRGQHALALAP